MDEQAVRAALTHCLDHAGKDDDVAHEIYREDAVLEFPQSGERFEGVANFREWRRVYPAKVTFELRRVRGRGDIWVAELLLRYDGGPPHHVVDILEFQDGKVAYETIYVTEGWAAPEWRATPPREPSAGSAPAA